MKRFLYSLAILCFVSTTAQNKFSQEILFTLDSIAMADVPPDAPGLATAIIKDGEVVFKKYAGYANLQDSVKIGQKSRFNLASTGKQFTALAVLWLEEQGKLGLEEDIRNYFPDVYPNLSNTISIQHLLHHTSGIRDIYDLLGLQGITWWEKTLNNQDIIEIVRQQEDLNFEPGSEYLYSNTNYILLAEIVAKVSNMSFVDFTNEMFSELGMDDTSFESDFRSIEGEIARPYFSFDTWSTYDWVWNAVGDGNIFTTLQDQISWEKTLQGFGNSSLPQSVIRRSQELDTLETNFQYGYGLEFGTYKNQPYRFHEGATGAWKALVMRFHQPKTTLITLTNSGKVIPTMRTHQMADVVLENTATRGNRKTAPDQEGEYLAEDDILGIYLTPENFSFEFKRNQDDKLVLNRIGRGEVELVREGANIFQQKYDPEFKQEFKLNNDGEMVVTAYHTSHAPYSLVRENSNWDSYDYEIINGTYQNNEIAVGIEILHSKEKNYLLKMNDQEYEGTLVTPTKLLFNGYVLRFSEKDGAVSEVLLDGTRIKKMRFQKME